MFHVNSNNEKRKHKILHNNQEFLYFCYEIYLIAEFIYRITLIYFFINSSLEDKGESKENFIIEFKANHSQIPKFPL